MQYLLSVVQSQHACKSEATPEPNVVESSRGGVENAGNTNEEHACACNAEDSAPVEELFAWGIVGNCSKSAH